MAPNTVFATRGCRGTCDFCAVPAARFGWAKRPVGDVIDEIRRIPARRIVFNDVNLIEDRDYAMELFTALGPLKKKWGGLATTRIGEDDELLSALKKSGCIYLLIGFESLCKAALSQIKKGVNLRSDYALLCRKLHDCGILIQGCFIFGFDHDTPDVFSRTVEAVNRLQIDIPRYAVYTPFPGTTAYTRLKKENRIIHENWRFYDTQHVVFQPAQMSVAELSTGFRRAWKETFTGTAILRRTLQAHRTFPVAFLGNLAYRLYVQKMKEECS